MTKAPPLIPSTLTFPFSAYSRLVPKSAWLEEAPPMGNVRTEKSRLISPKGVCGNSAGGVTPLGPIEGVMK